MRAGAVPSTGGPLVFVEDLSAPVLSDEDHHHLVRVRRLRTGEPLIVSDGAGAWRPTRLSGTDPEIVGDIVRSERWPQSIGVAFALTKGTKPELVVQKLTEVGVEDLRPFVAERSIVRWDQARSVAAVDRWRKVAREAAMQSRRAWLSTIHPVSRFDAVAALPGTCRADRGGSTLSIGHPVVLIGPEGGWSETELAVPLPTVALSDGVLRAETAAIAAGALLAAARLAAAISAGPT